MDIFKTWSFKWWEVALLKICLISLGIILGLYFFHALIGLMWLWLALFSATAVYFLIKLAKDK